LKEGANLSNFKMAGPILQNDENNGTKIALKHMRFKYWCWR